MRTFLIRRLPSVALMMVVASVIAFVLPRLAPGDPAVAMAGENPTAAQVAAVRAADGLNHPLYQQYLQWIGGLFRGNLGRSYILQRPVSQLIASRLGSTVQLAVLATLIMIVVGLALGIAGGSKRPKWVRAILDVVDTTLLAVPPFVTGLILIVMLGIAVPILPVSGEVDFFKSPELSIQYLILPATALALSQAAVIARVLQTSMWGVREEEFVDLATAKGLAPRTVTRRHVLRNSLGAAIIVTGVRIGELLGGAIVVEAIFARNGLGELAVTSVQTRDYLVLQALILGAVLVAVIIQLISEVLLAHLDPRIQLNGAR